MFTIAEKKKLTNDIFIFFEKILFKITKNNNTSGFIVAIFHYILVFVTFMLIISKHIGNFFWGIFFWIGIVLLHTFFNGCVFIRLERHLWKTKNWYGPWQIPLFLFEKIFNITPKTNPNLLQNMYIFLNTIILGFVIHRLYGYFNKIDDVEKSTSHKQLHLGLPPIDSEYRPHTNDRLLLEIQEQQ